jgi:hypothetical protein
MKIFTQTEDTKMNRSKSKTGTRGSAQEIIKPIKP